MPEFLNPCPCIPSSSAVDGRSVLGGPLNAFRGDWSPLHRVLSISRPLKSSYLYGNYGQPATGIDMSEPFAPATAGDGKMRLVQIHQFDRGHEHHSAMDRLCFLSKNLYNATLYESRRSYFDRRYKGYRVLQKQFQDENQPDYRALPAKVAQQTMMLVDRNFRSFFALNDMEPPPDPRPRIPGYLHRQKGRQAVIYTRQAISFREKGFVGLSGTGHQDSHFHRSGENQPGQARSLG